jgi:hypothetical protein
MIIVSQNFQNFNFNFPDDAVFRVNLAWINSISELKNILEKHKSHQIFLDLPINRTKPPNNKYTLDELLPIIISNEQIRYFAISNISSSGDLEPYQKLMPDYLIIVPKIESVEGIKNIKQITDSLKNEKIIMLDHDDLYSSIIKNDLPKSLFSESLSQLVNFCQTENIKLLRTIGVVFSDKEKRISEYVG